MEPRRRLSTRGRLGIAYAIVLGALAATCAILPTKYGFGQETAHVIPDPSITPGVVATTEKSEVCGVVNRMTYSQRHRLSQTPETKRLVFASYGIPWADAGKYEDDHDVPLCLGGADTLENRWPQPRYGTWTAGMKDHLETLACSRVCHDMMPLAEAQAWFTGPDWREAYCREIKGHPCPGN